ncbi:hypothetical protein [Pedobacter sp.]|uniref:hypothetical protein n=1 Tax=Pedobacter sp. TaxID=1411316 RepID=UPI003BAB1C02
MNLFSANLRFSAEIEAKIGAIEGKSDHSAGILMAAVGESASKRCIPLSLLKVLIGYAFLCFKTGVFTGISAYFIKLI